MTSLEEAVDALRTAGVRAPRRKPPGASDTGVRELDLWLDPADVATTDAVLERAGFHRVRVSGHAPHRFYVTLADGVWLKIDAKSTAGDPTRRRRLRSVVRRTPAGARRHGPVIAVLGPDGAGKSTLLSSLERAIPLRVNVTYLGNRRGATAAGGAAPRRRSGPARRLATSSVGELAFVARSLARRGRSLAKVYARAWTGSIELCDRHPVETLAIEPQRRPPARWFERLAVERLLPWPDLVVVLDAPVEVLHARKQEHPPERLAHWRQRYRDVFGPRGARFVATDVAPEIAADELGRHVLEALRARSRKGAVPPSELGGPL